MSETEPNPIKIIDDAFNQIATLQIQEFSEGISNIHQLVRENLDDDIKAYLRSKFEDKIGFPQINKFIQQHGLIELESKVDDIYISLNGAFMGAIYMTITGPIINFLKRGRTNPLEG